MKTWVRERLRSVPRGAVILAAVAFVAYVPAVWWGIPRPTSPELTHAWGVDDVTPLGVLAQVHNIVEPKEIQNYGYPLFHPFMVVGAYTPYLAFLYLTGGLEQPRGEYPYGLTDPAGSIWVMGMIGHLLSVLLGVGVVVTAYITAATLWDRRTGLVAGTMAMVSYPMFYYARTGNVDVPVLFFIGAALASFAAIVRHGFTTRRAIVLGGTVGLALATKEPAFASFLLVPPAIVVSEALGEGGWRRLRAPAFWRATAAGVAAFVMLFGLGSGLFVDPDWYLAHVRFASGRVAELAAGEIADLGSYPNTFSGNLALGGFLLGKLAAAMTPVGLGLAALGVVATARRERNTAWLVLPALSYLFVLFWMVRSGTLRYIMPASLPLFLYAARAVTLGVGKGGWWRRLAVAGGALTVAIGAAQGLDLTHAMVFDSRYGATAWLEREAEPGDVVGFFGASQKLPYLEAGVGITRVAQYEGAVYRADRSPAATANIVATLAHTRPRFVAIIPDHSSNPGEVFSATCPPEVFAGLMDGSLGYELAYTGETPRLFGWLPRPELDYPSVNPPIRIFVRTDRGTGGTGP